MRRLHMTHRDRQEHTDALWRSCSSHLATCRRRYMRCRSAWQREFQAPREASAAPMLPPATPIDVMSVELAIVTTRGGKVSGSIVQPARTVSGDRIAKSRGKRPQGVLIKLHTACSLLHPGTGSSRPGETTATSLWKLLLDKAAVN